MATISSILGKYTGKIDFLDLELIIAFVLGKKREFILAHPEFTITKNHGSRIINYAMRRINHEPLAYILGEKDFYGLKYKVNKDVLIPRPETELIVEKLISSLQSFVKYKNNNFIIVDVGTGSGNIIISIAYQSQSPEFKGLNLELYGTDISKKSLATAKLNAKLNRVDKKIKFLEGDLLNPVIQNSKFLPCQQAGKILNYNLLIIANLPYLSPKIYKKCSPDIKNYEPRSALISQNEGLDHYDKLLEQIKKWGFKNCRLYAYLEISPEQKSKIKNMINAYLPESEIKFYKDLAGRWRVCNFEVTNYKC